MRKLSFLLLFILILPVVHAATYNLVNDFSLTSNPNGAWRYGYSTTLGGTFNLFTGHYTSGWDTGVYASPHIWKNLSTVVNCAVLPGQVSMHSGPNGEFTIARWVAPSSTLINLNFKFYAGHDGNVDLYVIRNNATATPLFKTLGTYSDFSGSTTISVSAGDTIDFIVGYAGNWGADNTPIDVTITTIPEPNSLLVLGLFSGFLFFLKRK